MSEAVDWEAVAQPLALPPGEGGPELSDLTPGSKAACPECGKVLSVTQKGELRSHKCVNDIPTGGGKSGSRRSAKLPPKKVRDLGVAAMAGGVEWGTAHYVGRYVPCHPSVVPVDMGDDVDIMCGPVIDLLWPALPKGAQKVITAIADETDLILCALAWADYFRNIRQWAKSQHKAVLQARKEGANSGGIQGPPTESGGGTGERVDLGEVVPFRPAES